MVFYSFFLFLRFYPFIYSREGKGGEREGGKHQCVVASHTSPTRDLACNPGMCPDWELNQRPLVRRPTPNPLRHDSQGRKWLSMNSPYMSKDRSSEQIQLLQLPASGTSSPRNTETRPEVHTAPGQNLSQSIMTPTYSSKSPLIFPKNDLLSSTRPICRPFPYEDDN